VLVASLNQDGTFRRIGAVLLGCIRAYWIASLVSLAIAVLIVLLHSVLAGLMSLFVIAPVGIGLCIYRDLTVNVVKNNYGLCKGLTVQSREATRSRPGCTLSYRKQPVAR